MSKKHSFRQRDNNSLQENLSFHVHHALLFQERTGGLINNRAQTKGQKDDADAAQTEVPAAQLVSDRGEQPVTGSGEKAASVDQPLDPV